TLLGLVAGTLEPTTGRVKHGKTVRVAVLDQQFRELADIAAMRVREVLARTKATFAVDGKDLTPAQLLERLGFSRAHLSARVADLSGGQRRRLQLLLVLLSEPNVLILDEPTNDVDTDMLTAMEDLLDSWPGTLIVVSHDRYLLERVTDQQYAILDGRLRHVPGGVAEYLRLRADDGAAPGDRPARPGQGSSGQPAPGDGSAGGGGLTGAQLRAAQKQLASIERRLDKLSGQIAAQHELLAGHDQSDYTGLQAHTETLRALEAEVADLEEQWLEVSEHAG